MVALLTPASGARPITAYVETVLSIYVYLQVREWFVVQPCPGITGDGQRGPLFLI